ncbi:hypothetical protein TWF730_004307 [Orbilia blumenaviensis]|uniref:Uncharacterized protein n=1 Tax=Orbilia blumenaviensis TaxID=1796055 RepID=A0AAV9U021_9PEZI
MASQIPRPKRISISMDTNKSLPPLPPEPRTPQSHKFVGRSISYSVLQPPDSAPVSRIRDASCNSERLTRLKAELFGDREDGSDEDAGQKHVCRAMSLINSPDQTVTDDPGLYENSAWWAGRYTAINDYFMSEMPKSTQEERDIRIRRRMFELCEGNHEKQRSLQMWWVAFNMKQNQREETKKQQAVV